MATILKTKSVYFNDVNLIPTSGKLVSRKEVPKELHRTFVSPMETVVGSTFLKAAAKEGLSVTCPRFTEMENKIRWFYDFEKYKVSSKQMFFIALGLSESIDDLNILAKSGVAKNILLDIANGYVPQLKEQAVRVWNYIGDFRNLMVGNVVTGLGVINLENSFRGENFGKKLFIRVGIGNGGPCATSDETGVNRGQITELIECRDAVMLSKTELISDGGIYKPGYACKAFGAGADGVLMGSYFTRAREAETHISGDGTYYGCASSKQNKKVGLKKHSEGKEKKIEEKLESLEDIVFQYWGGISSCVSYCGFRSIGEMVGNGVFEIKENSLPPKKRE